MGNNNKTDPGQISKIQSAKDSVSHKPPTHGTPIPPKTISQSGK